MLNTVGPVEAPDEPLIPIRQLTTTSADYLPSTHPLTLSDKQTANRLGTFLANWKLITTDKWVLHAVLGYKIPFLSLSLSFPGVPFLWWIPARSSSFRLSSLWRRGRGQGSFTQ